MALEEVQVEVEELEKVVALEEELVVDLEEA